MKKTFSGELVSGHKQKAVEVPFDPEPEWQLQLQALRPGRRGFRVKATINSSAFDSAIVPRQKRWFLLIGSDVAASGEGEIYATASMRVLMSGRA
jgi:Domain of unknown function (DUF1905)